MSKGATTAQIPDEEFRYLPINEIQPSKTNPRKIFDAHKLQELTDSVKARGVLQPILVRVQLRGKKYEIVAGERRYRAASAAGLELIPAVVKTLEDKDVLEIQMIENLQREDLDPIDEAEGYLLLCREHGYRAEDLALKVDRSVSYVYSRMKLAELPKDAKAALREGDIPPSTGLLIARIPNAGIREKASKAILRKGQKNYRGEVLGPMTYGEARREIKEEFMLDLANAQFPIDAADLVPAAGSCLECPKRTGNQPALFADVQEGDLCTDPACFHKKGDAHWIQLQGIEREKGNEILGAKETREATRYSGFRAPEGYINLDNRHWDDPKGRNYQKLLGKDCPPQVIARDPESGQIHRLVREKDADQVLKDKYDWAKPKRSTVSQEDKKRREQSKIDAEVKRRVLGEIVAGAEASTNNGKEFWVCLANGTIERAWHDTLKDIVSRRGLQAEKLKFGGWDLAGCLRKAAAEMTIPQLQALTLEICMLPLVTGNGKHYDSDRSEAEAVLLSLFSVDRTAIRKAVVKELGAKKKPKAKKPAARKKSKTKKA